MSEEQEHKTFLVPVEDYQSLIDRLDERTLAAGFIGRWASREAFGQELLADTSAAERLTQLPGWLRGYVRLDGEAFVNDLETGGFYVITPVPSGVCVFDAGVVHKR